MTIRPVEHSPAPEYPDKYDAALRRVLTAAKPRRWLGTPLAAGVLSAAITLSMSGCATGASGPATAGGQTPQGGSAAPGTAPYVSPEIPASSSPAEFSPTDALPPSSQTPDIMDYVTMGEPMSYGFMVPFFEYGTGTGVIGCEVVAAPVFLSEEEAFAILVAAFADAGLTLSRDSMMIEKATIPVTNIYWDELYDPSTTSVGDFSSDGSVRLDGSQLEALPVEFVSAKDTESWHKDIVHIDPVYGEVTFASSVSSLNIRDAARTLVENNPNLVVFYDPISTVSYETLWTVERGEDESDDEYNARLNKIIEEDTKLARDGSKRMLQEQAEAFIQWLKEEGLC